MSSGGMTFAQNLTTDVNLSPSEGALAAAIQALGAISNEAQQAVRKLEALTGDSAPMNGKAVPDGVAALTGVSTASAVLSRASIPSGPTAKGGQMNPGDVLHPGDSISSANGNYLLAMQTDGNLVLYSGTSALWASNTNGKPVAVCIMQADGNLVLYDRSGGAVWSSGTYGNPAAHLDVQNDGNVVIYETNGTAAWATNTVHTIGSDTLIYRTRLKRWTNLFAFGTKGNDVVLVKLPPGATLKSVCIAPIDASDLNPNLNSPIGTQVGNSWAGARLVNVASGPGFVAIGAHWWFDAFSDAEYSISVWATGPAAYPVEDNGTLMSANMDGQIVSQVDQWFVNNEANLIAAGSQIATLCVVIITGGAVGPIAGAIISAVAAGAKVVLNPSGR